MSVLQVVLVLIRGVVGDRAGLAAENRAASTARSSAGQIEAPAASHARPRVLGLAFPALVELAFGAPDRPTP